MNKCNNEHKPDFPEKIPLISIKFSLNENLTQYLFYFLSYQELYIVAKTSAFFSEFLKFFKTERI